MAKGGRGGMSGRAGKAGRSAMRKASNRSRSANRSRNRTRSRGKGSSEENARNDAALQSEVQGAFDSIGQHGVGRKMAKLIKDRYKRGRVGRELRRTEAQRQRDVVHAMARRKLDDDIFHSTDLDDMGNGKTLNGLQRYIIDNDVGPAMSNAARSPHARGIDLFNAGVKSNGDALDNVASIMRSWADSYDFVMDVAQTYTQLVQDANSD